MNITIDHIVEQIPAVRAALADDIQRRRDAVAAERKALIDEISAVEASMMSIDLKIGEADIRLKKAQDEFDRARQERNTINGERGRLQAMISANWKRLYREFGNDKVSTTMFRIESYIAHHEAQARSLEGVVAFMLHPESMSVYGMKEPYDDIRALDGLRQKIADLKNERLGLLELLKADGHPDDIASSALSIADRLFGKARNSGNDDIA